MSWKTKLELGKGETNFDRAQALAARLIVASFRKYGQQHGLAPTAKMSDEELLATYRRVLTAFHLVAVERGEHLNAGIKNFIALYFFQFRESHTHEFFEERLQYELDRYRTCGLRETYKREIYPLELLGFKREAGNE